MRDGKYIFKLILPQRTSRHLECRLFFVTTTTERMMKFERYRLPITELSITEQFRFPKSKKKRIRKKWEKLDRNYRLSNKIYKHTAVFACAPYMETLLREFERYEQQQAKKCFKDQYTAPSSPIPSLTAELLKTILEQVKQDEWPRTQFTPIVFEP